MPTHSRRNILTGLGAMPILLLPSACDSKADAQHAGRSLRPVPGCEGCEAVREREPAALRPRLTLAGADEQGERLLVGGTVYRPDGRTAAAGVIVYVHHTNAAGLYADGTRESEWSRRHGRLRGWLKTGVDGRYEISTIKPGPYPGRADPAHIHMFVLEPGKADPYWIDDIVFDGEFGVTATYRRARTNQGGPGVVRLAPRMGGGFRAIRNILLA